MVAAWSTWRALSQTIIGVLCVTFVGMQSLDVYAANIGRYAKNMSFSTPCTEEDNVNIPIYGGYVSDYQITATFPKYYPLKEGQEDLCEPEYTGCERAWDMRPTAQIAYYDMTEQKLKFAWQSPGYYWYPIETPDKVNENVGQSVSLAYPPTHRHRFGQAAPPAIAYYDASAKRLMYIVRDTLGNWGEPETVDASGNVGQYAALRIGRDKRHHIVYYDADNGALKYTYKSNPDAVGGWATPTILDADGDVGQHVAMAIGPAGDLHVVYYNASAKALKYVAHHKEQGWSTPMVLDREGDVGQYASIFFGPDGSLHLGYYDATNKDLKYLYKEAAATSWPAPTVVDSDGDVGRFASLGVSAKGYPNIAYYDADNRSLKFISKTKKTMPNWDQPRVLASGGAGQFASLAMSGFVDEGTGKELYHDGNLIVNAEEVPGWPFESGMSVHVVGGQSTPDHHYIRIHKRADDQHDPPEVFVLYANGYARMLPQPPVWREDRECFGASVIIGPAPEDPLYPIIPIDRLDIDPQKLTVNVRYENGSSAVLHLKAERETTTLRVTDVTYDTLTVPFVTLRSMWVSDDNCDIARVDANSTSGTVRTYTMDPKREEWTQIPSDAWSFYRPVYSRHNTSCPDFKIEVLEPKGYMITMQAEDYRSGTLTKTVRKTASGGYTVRGPGEASYDLNVMEDITNAHIRVRYTKGNDAGALVMVYLDGVQQPTLELSHERMLGDYYMTQQVSLSSVMTAGAHTIRLEAPSSQGGVELDYLVIHSKAEEPGR